MRHFLFVFFLIMAAISAFAAPQGRSSFSTAQKIENRGNIDRAIKAYRSTLSSYPGTIYGGEALFRIAVLLDEKKHNPDKAIKAYKKYLKEYNGRHSKRAEIRIKELTPYSGSDPQKYKRFIEIRENHTRTKKKKYITQMEEFITQNSGLPYIHEAIVWTANEYKGYRRTIPKDKDPGELKKAMSLYREVIEKYSGTKSSIIAMKNLGDCHRMTGDHENAREYYTQAIEEGGEFGRLIVGNYIIMARQKIYRTKIFYGVIILFLVSLFFFLREIPINEFSMKGLQTGLRHFLIFLPGALAFTAIVYSLTDPAMDNHSGREPYIVMTLMATTGIALLFNGLVMETEERTSIRYIRYAVLLFSVLLCINFILLYLFKFLPVIEGLFI